MLSSRTQAPKPEASAGSTPRSHQRPRALRRSPEAHPSTAPAPTIVMVTLEQLEKLVRRAVEDAIAAQQQDVSPRFLDRNGIAKALGIGLATVDRFRKLGMHVGESPRFVLDECFEWMKTHLRGEALRGDRLIGAERDTHEPEENLPDADRGWTCVNCNAAGDPELDHPEAPERACCPRRAR
jgi:hypothetical protein